MASLGLIEDQQKQRFMAARLGEKSTAKDDLKLMVNKFEHRECPSSFTSPITFSITNTRDII